MTTQGRSHFAAAATLRQRRNITEFERCAHRAAVLLPRAISLDRSRLCIRFLFATRTLVRLPFQPVALGGPIEVELDYRIVSTGPFRSALSIRLRAPQPVFHPAVSFDGGPCLGAVEQMLRGGTRLDIAAIVLQLWDGLRYDSKVLNLAAGEALNPPAAMFVRANRAQLPVEKRPLYTAVPVPDLQKRPIVPLGKEWTPAEQLPGDRIWQPVFQRRLKDVRFANVLPRMRARDTK